MKKRTLFLWIIPILLILNAFYHSSLPAVQSDGLSLPIASSIQSFIQNIFSIQLELDFYNFIIRKSAHFLEYAAIGFSFLFAFTVNSTKKYSPILFFVFLVPILDELIQSITPGRSCQLSDMILDSFGILFGMLFLKLGHILYQKLSSKKKHQI